MPEAQLTRSGNDPIAPVMELTYVALAASLIVTRKRWQSGAVLAAKLAIIATCVAGVSF